MVWKVDTPVIIKCFINIFSFSAHTVFPTNKSLNEMSSSNRNHYSLIAVYSLLGKAHYLQNYRSNLFLKFEVCQKLFQIKPFFCRKSYPSVYKTETDIVVYIYQSILWIKSERVMIIILDINKSLSLKNTSDI